MSSQAGVEWRRPRQVVAHVQGAAEAGQASAGDGGGMAVAVDLEGSADEQVDGVLSCQLAEHPVERSEPSRPVKNTSGRWAM